MGRRSSKWSERKIAERTSRGYGSGELADYKGWFTIRDFSSRGITTRFASLELQRTMLFLSNIELNAFLASAREDGFFDYWEQFRLDRAETQEIAKGLGIKHPVYFGSSRPVIMTLDGVASFVRDKKLVVKAIDCKPRFRLDDPRTAEKLAIHQEYATRRGWQYERFTEASVSHFAIQTLKWMRAAFQWEDDEDQVIGGFDVWAMRLYAQMKRDEGTPRWKTQVRQYCYDFDAAHGVQTGCGLVCLRLLLLQKLVLMKSLDISHLEMLRSPLSKLRLRDLAYYGATVSSWKAFA